MNKTDTLAQHLSGPYQEEMARYHAILADLRADIEQLAPPLRTIVQPLVEKLVQGEFSQVVALLPFWLSDLLPVAPDVAHRLGLAHLHSWWYYYVQDGLLDGGLAPAALLGGHLALLRVVEIYQSLGLGQAPCWANFLRLTRTSAEAHAVELQARFTSLSELTPERLASLTLEFITDRCAPFFFYAEAQLYLAGVAPTDPLYTSLLAALRCFTAARQIGDDASDCLDDLQAGQLNYVSARLVSRFYEQGRVQNAADLDLERLAGYQINDEEFWNDIEQTDQQLCRQALDYLAPYRECRLRALIQRQIGNNAAYWNAAREHRAGLRALFA